MATSYPDELRTKMAELINTVNEQKVTHNQALQKLVNAQQFVANKEVKNNVVLLGGTLPPPAPPKEDDTATRAKTKAARRKDSQQITFADLKLGDKVRYIADPDDRFGTVESNVRSGSKYKVVFRGGGSTDLTQSWLATDAHTLWSKQIILAQPVETTQQGKVSFDSVILSEDKKAQIKAAISQIDHHHLIFNQWGFSDVFEKGTAISMLFYGPPGTGKTLMGQAIADKYHRKLQIISTAEIQTPEPGGAERNIKKAFDEAGDKTVLLFDECDGLITDRSRVGMILAAQINALLTGLEHYTGIAIFTTNRLEALDPAFDRRLSLKLEFPMPDREHREAIWKRMFPKRAPLDKDIRWADLASIEIAGGHIKNVVLKAARLAAVSKKKVITDEILWECLEKEVESMTAFTDAVESYNPWYGNAIKGGQGGMSLIRRPSGKHEVSRSE